MRVIRLIFLLISCSVTLAISAADTYTMNVGQFDKLKISSNVNVVYRCNPDSTGMAVYTGDEEMSKIFIFTNKGKGTLRIQLAQTQWNRAEVPTLYLYSDFLTDVESSSDNVVSVSGLQQCASFSVNQIGNGHISVEDINCINLTAKITTGNGIVSLSGKCTDASYRMLGAGQIMADRLVAENVKCSILGTGSIGCWAVDNLNVKGIGSTKIYYKGHPNIKKSGGGKLFELPDDPLETNAGAEVKSFEYNAGDSSDSRKDEDEDEEDEDEDEEEEEFDEDSPTVVTKDE